MYNEFKIENSSVASFLNSHTVNQMQCSLLPTLCRFYCNVELSASATGSFAVLMFNTRMPERSVDLHVRFSQNAGEDICEKGVSDQQLSIVIPQEGLSKGAGFLLPGSENKMVSW